MPTPTPANRTYSADDARQVAARIAAMRQARGWKQRELSQRSGIPADRLSRLEKGTPIRLEELVALCRAFGIGFEDLVFEGTLSGDTLVLLTNALRHAVPAKDLAALEWMLRTLLAGCRALLEAEKSAR